MDSTTVLTIYVSGVVVDVLFLLGILAYNLRKMRIYRANLQKIDVTYDPLIDYYYLRSEMTLKEIMKLKAEKILPMFFASLLSWLQVLNRINILIKNHKTMSQLLPEQKAAIDSIKHNTNLSGDEVRQKLQDFDENFYYRITAGPGNIPIVGEEAKESFSRLFSHALLDDKCRSILTPILSENYGVFTWRETAILKYALGEIDKDDLLNTIEEKTKTERERNVWKRQLDILTSVYKVESQQ